MDEQLDAGGIERSEAETVAVAGATGNAGREIVRALADQGYRVRALVRNPDRLGALRDNDGTVPAYGTHRLEAYYRERLKAETSSGR